MYNPAFDSLGITEKFRTLIWTRRYQTAGEFRLLVPYRSDYAQYLTAGNLVMQRGGTEAMEIEYVGFTQNEDEEELIEATGRTLMCWMDRRVTIRQIVSSGLTRQQILLRLIAQNITAPTDTSRKFPYSSIRARSTYADADISDYASTENTQLNENVEDLLADSDLGLRVWTDPLAKTHAFDVYRGQDLTVEQSAQDPCIFSTEFGMLGTHGYTRSTEAYRNVAYVYGNEYTEVVNSTRTGLERRELAVEASDISKTYTEEDGETVTLTEAQVRNILRQRGNEQLKLNTVEQTFTASVSPNAKMQFGTDYDLGDRVTCIDWRWGVAMNERITEVTQTWQDNKVELELVFGGGTPTLRSALRRYAKGR